MHDSASSSARFRTRRRPPPQVAQVRADVLTLVLPRCPIVSGLAAGIWRGARVAWHARFAPSHAIEDDEDDRMVY